jgi:hypothetical protein
MNYTVDFYSYIDTAELFAGLPAKVEPWRVLKPLAPVVTAALVPLFGGDFNLAFFAQVVVFYLTLVPVSFFFFRIFFRDSLFKTVAATAMFIWSFPAIRYALGPFTEAGAWFFYMLSLLLTLLFLRKPSGGLVLGNSLALTVGFLWKEYSVVSLLIANLAILFVPGVNRGAKAGYLAVLDGIFLLVNTLWQYAVYAAYRYTYFDWYIDGGLSAAPVAYNLANVLWSLTLVLFLGWIFVIPGFLRMKSHIKISQDRSFLTLLLSVPFVCLLWGAVDSRLFYVIAPGFVILSAVGMDSFTEKSWIKYAALVIIVAANFWSHIYL